MLRSPLFSPPASPLWQQNCQFVLANVTLLEEQLLFYLAKVDTVKADLQFYLVNVKVVKADLAFYFVKLHISCYICRLWGSSGMVWEALEELWQALGELWQDLADLLEALGGSCRPWESLGGSGDAPGGWWRLLEAFGAS